MQDQPISDQRAKVPLSDEHLDCEVLHLMLYDHPAPWSLGELAVALEDEGDALDAGGRLKRAGLVHRFGDFVIPARVARRACELQIGTA